MTYLTDDEIAGLPEDAHEAFVNGEKILRDRLEERLLELYEEGNTDHLTQAYMNNVLALARYFEINEIACWNRAIPRSHNWAEYLHFTAEVDACTVEMRLASIRRTKDNSVALDVDAKNKLRLLLEHIRETVDNLDISTAKKEALFRRIWALQEEIDRDRTRYQAFAALVIEVCDDAGEAAKRLEPVVRLVERVGNALGIAKRAENSQPRLPPHRESKKLEAPKQNTNDSVMTFEGEIPS